MHAKSLIPLISAALLAGCGHKTEPGRTETPAGVAIPAQAGTVTVAAEPFRERLDIMGTVAAAARAQVSAKVPAEVREVFCNAGQAVTNGQLLLRLDDRDLREQLATAAAQLEQAQAELRRVSALFEKQAATEQMKLAAETAARSAKAQVERATVALSWTEVRAPIAGIVTDRQVDIGDLAAPGRPLLNLFDPSRLRLEADVPLRLVEKLPLGALADVTLDNPARAVKGRVEEIVAEADPASRTQRIKLTLEKADGLRPGQFGRVWVELDPREVVFVPASALYRTGQLAYAMVVDGSLAQRRLVKTGRTSGEKIEVLSGLTAGEKILAQPVLQ